MQVAWSLVWKWQGAEHSRLEGVSYPTLYLCGCFVLVLFRLGPEPVTEAQTPVRLHLYPCLRLDVTNSDKAYPTSDLGTLGRPQ